MASTSHRGQGGAYTVTPPAASGYLNVKDYGALGDGSTDDRASITTALAAAVAGDYAGLYFPKGTYMVSRNSANNTGIDVNGITDVAFVGCGWNSVIKMPKTFADDFNLFRLRNGAARISFQDLTFDGNWVDESGNEQVHLLVCGTGEVTGTVSDVSIRNCWFKNCKGDAVRLLGADSGGEVSNVNISDCRFTDTDRCGIAVQRGSYDVHVSNNYFSGGSDQQLDMEATGASSVGRYVITGNTFDGTDRDDVTILVTLGGNSDSNPNTSTTFANNIVRGRMQMTNVVNLRFTDNQIVPGIELTLEPIVNFIRVCKNATVSGNHFERATGSTAGIVVQFTQNTSLVPDGIVFTDNTVVQNTAYTCVSFDGCDNVLASNNLVKFNSSNTATYAAIVLDATLGNLQSFTASGNTIVGNLGGGTLGYGVQVNARSNAIARAVVIGNSVRSAVTGVAFQKTAGSFTNYPVCTGNSFTSATTAVEATSQTILVGGQQGGVVVLVGGGSPESVVTAPIGSAFYRNDGSTGTTLYTKDSGSSNTGWISLGAVTVANDSITFAKMQNIATDRLIGRDTASSGDPEEISVGGGLEWTGSAGIQRSALTGDVTAAAGSGTTAIASNAVTTAKILDANVTTAKLEVGVLSADAAGRALFAANVINAATLLIAVADGAFAADAATRALFADAFLTKAKAAVFVSTEQTGTGASQNVAHGLSAVPAAVLVVPTELVADLAAGYDCAEGAHDSTNVVVTVTSGLKFKVFAWA